MRQHQPGIRLAWGMWSNTPGKCHAHRPVSPTGAHTPGTALHTQVQAAEAASRPVNTFRPGATRSTQQQQQQQQPQQPPAWLQQQPQQQQPAWMSSLPSMTLNTQLPRFSQTAGGATTGAAVGIARPLPQPAAAAAGGSSQPPPQQQQQQVPINAVLVSRRQQGNPVLKHIRCALTGAGFFLQGKGSPIKAVRLYSVVPDRVCCC